MLKCIEKQEEQARFALLYQITNGECKKETDNSSYFMAQTKIGYPVWVWTKNNISKNKIKEVQDKMKHFIIDNEKVNFTCKKEFYDILKNNKFDVLTNDYFEMGSYYCNQTIKPRSAKGNIFLANMEDVEILANYHIWDNKEINNINISKSDAIKHIAELIEKKVFYVWRDQNNKIVCTAALNTNLQFARINHVYTPVEERCKGYAKNLIYVLTNKALDEGFIPVMYTDYNYPASNKAYKAVGYEDVGVLINFSCQNS